MNKRAVWASRHTPYPDMIEDLAKRGYDLQELPNLKACNYTFYSGRHAWELLCSEGIPDLVVGVLPLHLLDDLVYYAELSGVPVVRPVMYSRRRSKEESKYAWTGRWYRIVSVQMEEWQ